MQETVLNGESMNIVKDNIEKLKSIFPDVFTEGKVDFDKLQDVLGNYIENKDERYNFTWNGKSAALRLAQTPSTGTLRPCKEDSKNWDTTQNLYIEGDNLEVLKLLQKSYHNKIKMIYIDPPYNTGNDFVYKDDFKDNLENYKKITGQIDSEGNKISSNTESDGRYHTNWLNMMYPRLKLARNLLSENGVIFISIDDNELDNLRKICNEIYGENNHLGVIARKTKLTSNKGTFLAPSHEYIVIYAKNISFTEGFNDSEAQESESYLKLFKYEDEYSKYNIVGLYQPSLDPMRGCSNQRYYIKCPDGSYVIPKGNVFPDIVEDGSHVMPQSADDKVWRWSYESYLKQKDNLVFLETSTSPLVNENNEQAKWNVYTKIYLKDRLDSGMLPVSFMDKYPNSEASKELIKMQIPFSFSKPKNLIKYLMKIMNFSKNDIILDFFSGSATTAHACMSLNADDNQDRRFIMVQLPEKADISSDTEFKFNTICEIGEERIKKAGELIKEEINNKQLKIGEESKKIPDIGFKVFKLDTSNIKKWNGNADTIESEIQGSIFNYEVGRSELDVVYEIMLKCGLDLTYPIEEINVNGKTLYSIGAGAMFVCMDDNITQDIADKIVEIKDTNDIVEPVAVFKDNGFTTDSIKTNIKETLRVAGIKDFITV